MKAVALSSLSEADQRNPVGVPMCSGSHHMCQCGRPRARHRTRSRVTSLPGPEARNKRTLQKVICGVGMLSDPHMSNY